MSQGLIPLPIGRKGDTDGAADLIPESSEKRRHTVAAAVENDHPKEWIHSHTQFDTFLFQMRCLQNFCIHVWQITQPHL